MNDRKDQFRDFMKTWRSENVVTLYDQHIDPSDRKYLIQQRANRLKEMAREKGMLSLLYDEIGPKSDVFQYAKELFDAADVRKRSGID
jgi:hypothetical protein